MKKILVVLLTLAMLMSLATFASAEKVKVKKTIYKTIEGNKIERGDFNEEDGLENYFWLNPDDGPYRGGTCTWVEMGPDGSGCLKMEGVMTMGSCPGLCSKNEVNKPMFPQVVEGKEYVAFVDILVSDGCYADITFDAENAQHFAAHTTVGKTGEWERLLIKFTADRTGDFYLRVFDGGYAIDPALDQYILIDNFYFAEYNASVDYMATEEIEVEVEQSETTKTEVTTAEETTKAKDETTKVEDTTKADEVTTVADGTAEVTEKTEGEEKSNSAIFFIIGGVALVAVIVVVIIIAKKKK